MVRVVRGNLPGTLERDVGHGMLLPSSVGRACALSHIVKIFKFPPPLPAKITSEAILD